MKHTFLLRIDTEAGDRETAAKKLAPFLLNPRNPNLLPSDVVLLDFYIGADQNLATRDQASRESNDDEKEVWSIWVYGYGWGWSKNVDGKEPNKLYTKKDAEKFLADYCPRWNEEYSVRRYECRQ